MTPAVNLDQLKRLLGTLDFLCALCHEPISRADFEGDRVLAMTGPKHTVAAHIHHFFTPDGKGTTASYERNLKQVGYVYCVLNDLPMREGQA